MAGHNKWSKIKHKKASTDAAKSRVFSKLARLITVEARAAEGNRESPALRTAIEKARAQNMPTDNINRAIERGAQKDGAGFEKIIYEAYGPGGCAILVSVLTDNRNRSAAEVRHCLSKYGVSMSNPGAALWMFEQKDSQYNPKDTLSLSDSDMEKMATLTEALLELEDVGEVITNASHE